ncbi:Outer membrane protein TolC [Mariprofundus ferrinatatus]|uniref:Outer membrane protein TolC n=1 Tax=Mariprofundus ferrinatatus TaxID=1921087 RepID=A0A2K8L4I6_9PROT|nr:TolC family protein [Mariprofundus ferrinatatus]ATX82153.1 Outer membrane protein TolC [Mariprofundus ferrinatatus]
MSDRTALRAEVSVNYNYIIKSTLFAAVMILSATAAVAGEISTLRQSVEYALEHNRMLGANAQSVEQANASVSDATGRLLPRVDLSTGVARTNAPGDYFGIKLNQKAITAADFNPVLMNNPGYINNYQTRIGVTMPVFQGGALWAGRSIASHQAEASQYGHHYMRQQVVFQTVSAYARVRQAQAQIAAMESAVTAASKRLQDTEAMQNRGVLIKSDVMDARVHLLRMSVKLEEAKNGFSSSKDRLEQVMGLNGDVHLNTEEDPKLKMPALSLDEAVEKALASRPDLMAIENQHKAASAGVHQSRASFLPHVNLVAAQDWNSPTFGMNNRNTMVGATVTMNLFSGGSDTAKIRAAQAEEVSLEYRVGDLKQQIHNEVSHAWRQLAESQMRHESENEAMQQSIESLRIKSLRYEQGLTSTSDLLDAQVQADSMRVAAIQARYDVTVAQAALLLSIGMLNEEVIQ